MLQFRIRAEAFALALAVALLLPQGNSQEVRSSHATVNLLSQAAGSMTLVWSDEFNGPNGALPDAKKWDVVTNDSGYGNRELEYYTDRPVNVHEKDGHLIITARKESFTGPDGQTRAYTSARLESKKKFNVQYGRIEARIRLPKGGQGLWPAFWLLGSDFETVGWPKCGEIDIMENVGFEPSTVHGSLHGPGYSGANPLTGIYVLPGKERFSEGFHVFAVEWEPREIRFYVDGELFETQKADSLAPGKTWVFDHPFYIIVNLAVGGYWPGEPNGTTALPSEMLVDYVRVYQLNHQDSVH